MKSLSSFISESLLYEAKAKKEFDPKIQKWFDENTSIQKRIKRSKKLKEYPDGIGLNKSECISNIGEEGIWLYLYDQKTDRPIEIPSEVSREFLAQWVAFVHVRFEQLEDRNFKKTLELFPKLTYLMSSPVKMSKDGSGNTYTVDDLVKLLKQIGNPPLMLRCKFQGTQEEYSEVWPEFKKKIKDGLKQEQLVFEG